MKVTAKVYSKIPSFPAIKFKNPFPVRIEVPATRILSPIQISKFTVQRFSLDAYKSGWFGSPFGEKKNSLYDSEINVTGPMVTTSEIQIVDENDNVIQNVYVDPGLSVTLDYKSFSDTIDDMADLVYNYSAEIKHEVQSPTDKLPNFVFSAMLPVEQRRTLYLIDEDTLDKPEFTWKDFEKFWKNKLPYYLEDVQTVGFDTYSGTNIPKPKPEGDVVYTMMFNDKEHAFCFEATTNYSEAGMYTNKFTLKFVKGSTNTSKVFTVFLPRLIKESGVNATLHVGFVERTYIGRFLDPSTGNEVDTFIKYTRELNASSGGSIIGVWGVPDEITVNLRWDGNGTAPLVAVEYMSFLMLE